MTKIVNVRWCIMSAVQDAWHDPTRDASWHDNLLPCAIFNVFTGKNIQLPFIWFMIHFIKPPLATWSHPSLGCPPFLIPEFPLCPLVTEDFNLTVSSMWRGTAYFWPGVFVGINLYVQWKTFYSFLCTEIKNIIIALNWVIISLSIYLKSVERHCTARFTLAGESIGFQYTARALWESSSIHPTSPRLFLVSTSMILCFTWDKTEFNEWQVDGWIWSDLYNFYPHFICPRKNVPTA